MRNIIIVFLLLLTLTGCSNRDYARFTPREIMYRSTFQEFSWSPDGARAAVYLDGKMNIINPDGEKIGSEVSMSTSDFKKCQWIKKDENWEYAIITKADSSKASREGNDSSETSEIRPEDDKIKNNVENNYPNEVYNEEVKLDKGITVYLSYTGKYFEVIRSNPVNKEYVTIFKSNQILMGLNSFKGNIYFVGMNPKDSSYRYTLYKVAKDKVQTIYMH